MGRASTSRSSSASDEGTDVDGLVGRVLQDLPQPVLVCKHGGRIVLANQALHDLLGYDDGALVGRKVGRILPEDFRDPSRSQEGFSLPAGPDEDRPVAPVHARCLDGRLVAVAVSLATLPGVGRPLSVAVLRPLGPPVAAEDAVATSGSAPTTGPSEGAAPGEAAAPADDDRARTEVEGLRAELDRARAELEVALAGIEVLSSRQRGLEDLARLDRFALSSSDPLAVADAAAGAVARNLPHLPGPLPGLEPGAPAAPDRLAEALQELARAAEDVDESSFLDHLAAVVGASARRATSGSEPEPAALHDPLTRLPRRALLRDRLDQALSQGSRTGALAGALIIDIDDFEDLNQAYGAAVGDQLLLAIAERLTQAAGPDDVLARMRADEFAVLHVTDRSGLDEFTDLADRIAVALDPPFAVDELSLRVTASVGISVWPADSATADQMLREADVAVDRAKSAGRGRSELFDHGLRRQAMRRIDQATALRRAIDEEELVVVWQAAFPLQPPVPGAPPEVWAEALVRWRNPERGLVSPGNFIQLAEETGLIVPVGRFVLGAACRQLADWRERDGLHPSRISVNLSPRELAQDDLVAGVADAVGSAGIEPGAVTLEITESVITAGPDDAIRRLNELRDLGVELAMDDFGTGDSSLGFLRRLPVSVLKIDQSFIRGLTTHRADWAIVRGLVEMGHGIGLTVVAEGIETGEQLDQLVALGCDRGQGYFWSSPVPADALDGLLEAWDEPTS